SCWKIRYNKQISRVISMLDLDRIPNQEQLLRAYKVFFQPPIFDIRIDNPIHKGDRISQPS
ncbi:hypothetical protein, partial [Cylindrospermopsis raciborskii]|uniref:hypothetical protein n=1 Tax=Cylindrospermopsis raciborskii TaxID=77022 RepID=UPI003879F567